MAKPASQSRTIRAGRYMRAIGVLFGLLTPAATWALSQIHVIEGTVSPWLYLFIGAGLSLIPAGQAMIELRRITSEPIQKDA